VAIAAVSSALIVIVGIKTIPPLLTVQKSAWRKCDLAGVLCLFRSLRTPFLDSLRFADKPSVGELITGFERYDDLSPTIGFVLRLHVRESIQ
jgi:hypothetical protein